MIQSFGSQCPYIKLYRKVPKCVCWLSIGFALRPESFVCEGKLRNLPLTSISTSPNKRSPKINQQNIISLNKGLLHTNTLKRNDLYAVKLQKLFSLRWWVLYHNKLVSKQKNEISETKSLWATSLLLIHLSSFTS